MMYVYAKYVWLCGQAHLGLSRVQSQYARVGATQNMKTKEAYYARAGRIGRHWVRSFNLLFSVYFSAVEEAGLDFMVKACCERRFEGIE